MSSGQADRSIQDADYAKSADNKIKHLTEAIKALTYAVRELETKVSVLEGRH